jgi:hypothetical protein
MRISFETIAPFEHPTCTERHTIVEAFLGVVIFSLLEKAILLDTKLFKAFYKLE